MLGPDQSYAVVLDGLPASLRRSAEELPFRLGLVSERPGRWSDFVRLFPNQELPWFVAEDAGSRDGWVVDPVSLGRFRFAHHCGGFAGLVEDRLLDGQIQAEPNLLDLRARLVECWVDALGVALGDKELARTRVQASLRALHSAVRADACRAKPGALSLREYVAQTLARLHWIEVSGLSLLERAGDCERTASFVRSYGYLLLALQVLDDARDASEDGQLLGASVAERLGIDNDVLAASALGLIRRALTEAALGRFALLHGWLYVFERRCERLIPQSADMASRALAQCIVAYADELLRRRATERGWSDA